MAKRLYILAMAAALLLWVPSAGAGEQGLQVKLSPNLVEIGVFFGGTTVSLEGQAPASSQVAVVMQGPLQESRFKRKEHTLGLFWMNHGEVIFRRIPSVYLVYTSTGVSPQMAQVGNFGYRAVEHTAQIIPVQDEDFLFGEFVKLKEEAGLYTWQKGKVRLDSTGHFQTTLFIAPRMPIGEYHLRVLALGQGKLLAERGLTLRVRETKILEQLSNLARNHGLLYGILAVLAAIGAGLLMDLIFGTKKGLH